LAVKGFSKIKIERGGKVKIFSDALVDEKDDLNVESSVDRKLKSWDVTKVLFSAFDKTDEKNAFSFSLTNRDSYDLWENFSYVLCGGRTEE